MSELSIIVEPEPPKAWVEVVERGLRNHNIAATGIVEFYPVAFVVKDGGGAVVGGLSWGISPADGCMCDRCGSTGCGAGAATRSS